MARLTWRWIDGMDNAAPFRSGDFGFPDPNMAVPAIGSKNYFDLGLTYRFSDNIEARLTIANLTDTEAPNLADTVNDQNTDSGFKFSYDGDVLAKFTQRRACTRATGTIDSVFFRASGGTVRVETATNSAKHIAPMRPPCQDGVIISDGHLYWGPWMCGCR